MPGAARLLAPDMKPSFGAPLAEIPVICFSIPIKSRNFLHNADE